MTNLNNNEMDFQENFRKIQRFRSLYMNGSIRHTA